MLARVVGTQKWRRVAEEDRGTEQGHSAVSSLRQGAHKTATGRPQDCHRAPTRDAPTDAWGLTPFGGMVSGPRGRFLAWARIARMCLSFKSRGEIAGLGRIGGEKWRRRGDGQDVGGVGWGTGGNGWRGRVTLFSGTGERIGRDWPRLCGRVVRWGVRGKSGKQYGEHKAMAVGSESGAGAGCWRGRRFWARLVI